MNDWQTRDERYLQAALDWLRAKFADFLCRRSKDGQAARVADDLGGRLAAADSARQAAESGTPPPALTVLMDKLRPCNGGQTDGEQLQRADRLRHFEQQLLLLCVGAELDPWIARGCREIQGAGDGYPTFLLAQQLFEAESGVVQQAMAADQPLRYLQLIEVFQPGGVSLAESRLSASEWLLNVAHGRHVIDELLTRLVVPLDLPDAAQEDVILSDSQRAHVDASLELLRRDADAGHAWPLVQLVGPDSFSKQQVARYLVHKYRQIDPRLALYRLPSDSLPSDPVGLATFLRLWLRESYWARPALYLDLHNFDFDQKNNSQSLAVRQLIERVRGITLLDTRTMPPAMGRRTITVEVSKPTAEEQFDAWRFLANADAARLASQFNLNLGAIQQIANARGDFEFAWNHCLQRTRPRLDRLAQRIEVKATLADLQLPAIQKRLLQQIADQVQQRYRVYDEWKFRERMNRGLGISVLFAGDSGTGKTMAAETIAHRLDLPLYRIDLSAVVSKYIGETEKNLRRMFDAFEDGGAVLLFDEADSLFGKRSEVKDSHDRYANIQIDYLLQRMEAFSGLAILATNMKSSLDQAFLRRLRFVIDFPLPGPAERQLIWRNVFPAKEDLPREDLDFVKLAKFNLTGGHIQTIAINAAGLAAGEAKKEQEKEQQRKLTMRHVLEATKNEFRKLARPINESDFQWQPTEESELVSV